MFTTKQGIAWWSKHFSCFSSWWTSNGNYSRIMSYFFTLNSSAGTTVVFVTTDRSRRGEYICCWTRPSHAEGQWTSSPAFCESKSFAPRNNIKKKVGKQWHPTWVTSGNSSEGYFTRKELIACEEQNVRQQKRRRTTPCSPSDDYYARSWSSNIKANPYEIKN
jgi:hypothetical protein